MIRAMILWLLGATFEVRLINSKTGKDIPGRCLYKGGYWKARRVYRNKRLKYGYVVRLQAVSLLDHRINATKPMTIEEAQDNQNYIANKRLDNIKTATGLPHDFDEKLMDAGKRLNEPHDISTSNAEQSASFEKDPGAAFEAYQGEDYGDHECDSNGPLEFHKVLDDYRPTCSICGTLQEISESEPMSSPLERNEP